MLVTALVVSEPSSRTIQLTFWPPIVAGSSSNVFFSGMPSEAAGPVADSVTPTLISAMRRKGATPQAATASAAIRFVSMVNGRAFAIPPGTSA